MRSNMIRNFASFEQMHPGLLAFVILACVLLLYLPFLSRHITGDDIIVRLYWGSLPPDSRHKRL